MLIETINCCGLSLSFTVVGIKEDWSYGFLYLIEFLHIGSAIEFSENVRILVISSFREVR